MAKVKCDGKVIDVKDGDSIKDACSELGVPFGCDDGICGVCMIEILSGEKNLSELTEQEKNFDCNSKTRLACQCKIKKGEVEFKC